MTVFTEFIKTYTNLEYIPKILFFLGALGVFNSIGLSIYFLTTNLYKSLSNKLFGLFLFVLSLRVLKSLFYAFSTKAPIFILQSGPAFFLLIGPLLLTYVKSYTKTTPLTIKYWKIHITVWAIVVICLMVLVPFSDHVKFNKQTLLPIINLQWLVYIVLSAYSLKPSITNFKKSTPVKRWLMLLILSNLTLWLAFYFVPFTYFVSGSIIFSCLFCSLFIYYLLNKKLVKKVFLQKIKKKNAPFIAQHEALIQKLRHLIISEHLYTNPHLKISDVANKLGVSIHELSSLINTNLGINFNEFLNQYRVEEAKKLLKEKTNFTIDAIGNQAGFNSKSAFYKAFKKYCGTTPAKYKV